MTSRSACVAAFAAAVMLLGCRSREGGGGCGNSVVDCAGTPCVDGMGAPNYRCPLSGENDVTMYLREASSYRVSFNCPDENACNAAVASWNADFGTASCGGGGSRLEVAVQDDGECYCPAATCDAIGLADGGCNEAAIGLCLNGASKTAEIV